MDYSTRQTVSFAVHSTAELLGIKKENVEARYDDIEKQMLAEFFSFAAGKLDRVWIHWNMRNLTFGFEHLEHRSRRLGNQSPPTISVEQRLNLNDMLKEKYGENYVSDPKMKSLVLLNGVLPPSFLDGGQEAAAFKSKDFIRMHSSTICKVEFFRSVIILAQKGRLKTTSKDVGVKVDRLMESRSAKAAALCAAAFGFVVSIYQLLLWMRGN